jgi:hypothetical protein
MRSRTSLSRNDSAVIMPAPPQLSEQCPSADAMREGEASAGMSISRQACQPWAQVRLSGAGDGMSQLCVELNWAVVVTLPSAVRNWMRSVVCLLLWNRE